MLNGIDAVKKPVPITVVRSPSGRTKKTSTNISSALGVSSVTSEANAGEKLQKIKLIITTR
jgi:hypothetical protein